MNCRLAFPSIAALALAGCAVTPPAAPAVSPEAAAVNFDARSLQDAGLHAFLAENLGHEPTTWDFETLSWVAFYFHPALAVARAQWATARATRQSVAARPNPTISLIPGYNSTREPGLSPWMPAINFDFLLQGTKRDRQQAIAAADLEVARLGVLSTAWQIRSEVRRALIDLQAAQGHERGLREQARAQEQLVKLMAQRLAAGRASASESAAARLASLRLQASLADAAAQLTGARARLAAALGLPLAALDGQHFLMPPAPALSAEALAAARRESLRSRADVLGALAKFHAAHAAVELEFAKQQPDMHLGPGYQWDQGANKWSLALTLELPLFHRNEGPIAEATARRAEAAAQFNLVQAQVIAAIDTAIAAQFSAAQQVAHLRILRDETMAQTTLVQKRFDLGAADQVERQAAAVELATAELAFADAEATAALAAGQLEDALQIPFPRLAAIADPAHPELTRTP